MVDIYISILLGWYSFNDFGYTVYLKSIIHRDLKFSTITYTTIFEARRHFQNI